MIQEIKNHKIAYSVLALALLCFVVAYLQVWPDKQLQKVVVLCLGVFYFFWGVIVHKRMSHIHPRIVLEYLAISILAVLLLLLLLN